MNKAESVSEPFQFCSPVEFVLIGVQGKKRAVMAKSKGAQLDLVAYAQRQSDHNDRRRHYTFLMPFPLPLQLHPLSIDSLPILLESNRASDERPSELTLVWRGAAYGESIACVGEEFRSNVNGIAEALDNQSAADLEWALAPVIDRCNRATSHYKRRRLLLVYAFWFALLVYLVAALVVALPLLGSKLGFR